MEFWTTTIAATLFLPQSWPFALVVSVLVLVVSVAALVVVTVAARVANVVATVVLVVAADPMIDYSVDEWRLDFVG